MLVYIIVGGVLVATFVPAAIQIGLRLIKPKIRGNTGESKVDRCLRKFKGPGFAQTKDIMLPTRGKTSQIDNLLVSRYGVFVIEVKNYSGIINGRERSSNWVQVFPGSSQKSREFYNPIWQNEGHIRALKELLGRSFPKLQYHNIVVFSDECKPPRIPGVVTFRGLHNFLQASMHGSPVLTNEEVASIKAIIEKNNVKDRTQRTEHISYARDSAVKAKERQRKEVIRRRAEENKGMAMQVQAVYSQGRSNFNSFTSENLVDEQSSLETKISTAKIVCSIENTQNSHSTDRCVR